MQIHSQLLQDCHLLGQLSQCYLLLHKNASVPWFILVPQTSLTDLLDLPAEQREQVLEECAALSRFIKENLNWPKINFASLGNVVPQMHLHVVGRSATDDCWPAPVWGNLPVQVHYDAEILEKWTQTLRDQYGLRDVPTHCS